MKRIVLLAALLLVAGCSSTRMLTQLEMRQHLHAYGLENYNFTYDCPTPNAAHLTVDSFTVESLSFVHEIKLTSLYISTTGITDASPLKGYKLRSIHFNPLLVTNGVKAIRNMTSLTEINGVSPEEFWSQYDSGAFSTPKVVAWPKNTFPRFDR